MFIDVSFSKIARSFILILKISPITKSAKNFSSNMANNAELSGNGGNQNKTIKRLLHTSNSNKETDYLIG